ncbi:phage coat protein [Cupriavidus taiwanensis]|uniref:phage coat protein n=1 Tax=Cupriavidus taiwanensis TaxID=164546 RepID=UPI000E12977E|nr:phage coat protein [Cupriavidus taiwanensis]SOZ97313.1 Major coat protein (modular protein) [Cupriavidus taiwanensis]
MGRHFSRKAIVSGAALAAVMGSAHAQAAGVADIFAAVDLSTVSTFVIATGVVIVGIALAFKGISLAKRGVNKA